MSALMDMVREYEAQIENQQEVIDELQKERTELISLNLWSARRLHNVHKKFAYDELEVITGDTHERI